LPDVNLFIIGGTPYFTRSAFSSQLDVEAFPILRSILSRVVGEGEEVYQSPTDMGVNRAGAGIVDDDAVREASLQEVIRRYFRHDWEQKRGLCSREVVARCERLMARLGLAATDRPVVEEAREAAVEAEAEERGNEGFYCGAAVELDDGTIVTGKNSELLHSASAAIINAIKHAAGLPEDMHLLTANVVQSLTDLKANYLGSNSPSLNVQEVLVALGISAAVNPAAKAGVEALPRLQGAQMHLTHEPGQGDEYGLRKLGIAMTTDARPTETGYFLR
jgi:uncharacterized protein (UPF0371 family)